MSDPIDLAAKKPKKSVFPPAHPKPIAASPLVLGGGVKKPAAPKPAQKAPKPVAQKPVAQKAPKPTPKPVAPKVSRPAPKPAARPAPVASRPVSSARPKRGVLTAAQRTEKQIRGIQRDSGIKVTGKVGVKTSAEIQRRAALPGHFRAKAAAAALAGHANRAASMSAKSQKAHVLRQNVSKAQGAVAKAAATQKKTRWVSKAVATEQTRHENYAAQNTSKPKSMGPRPGKTITSKAFSPAKRKGKKAQTAVKSMTSRPKRPVNLSNEGRTRSSLIDLGKEGGRWKHGYIPLNAAATRIKSHGYGHGGANGLSENHLNNPDKIDFSGMSDAEAHLSVKQLRQKAKNVEDPAWAAGLNAAAARGTAARSQAKVARTKTLDTGALKGEDGGMSASDAPHPNEAMNAIRRDALNVSAGAYKNSRKGGEKHIGPQGEGSLYYTGGRGYEVHSKDTTSGLLNAITFHDDAEKASVALHRALYGAPRDNEEKRAWRAEEAPEVAPRNPVTTGGGRRAQRQGEDTSMSASEIENAANRKWLKAGSDYAALVGSGVSPESPEAKQSWASTESALAEYKSILDPGKAKRDASWKDSMEKGKAEAKTKSDRLLAEQLASLSDEDLGRKIAGYNTQGLPDLAAPFQKELASRTAADKRTARQKAR